MLAFGGNLTAFNVLNYFAVRLDTVLVGRFCGAMLLGYYSKALGLLLMPLRQMHGPVSAVAIPALSRLVDQPNRYRHAYFSLVNQIALLAVSGVAFMIATSDWIIRVVLGPQWGPTAPLFTILGFAGLVIPVLSPTGWLFVSQDRTREMLYLGFAGNLIKITAICIGFYWGITGVAIAVAVRSYIETPIALWVAGRRGPVRMLDYLPSLSMAAMLAAGVLASVLVFRRLVEISNPVAGLFSSFAVAAVAVLALTGITRIGRDTIKNTVDSAISLLKPTLQEKTACPA
jgi:PST family polysaccharide transporter